MHCICVDPARVHLVWPLVKHLIYDATAKGGGDFCAVEADTLKGDKLLWVAADEATIWAAAVTGLHIEQGQKFCCIWACGGRERERWLPLKAELEKFAKIEGCASIRIYGRRGWARLFKDYKLISITLEKAL